MKLRIQESLIYEFDGASATENGTEEEVKSHFDFLKDTCKKACCWVTVTHDEPLKFTLEILAQKCTLDEELMVSLLYYVIEPADSFIQYVSAGGDVTLEVWKRDNQKFSIAQVVKVVKVVSEQGLTEFDDISTFEKVLRENL